MASGPRRRRPTARDGAFAEAQAEIGAPTFAPLVADAPVS